MGAGILRIQLERPPDFGDPLLDPAAVDEIDSQLPPGACQAWIPLEGLPERRNGPLGQLVEAQIRGLQVVGAPQLRPRPRVSGIEGHRPFEEKDGAVEGFRTFGAKVDDPLRERLVGFQDVGFVPLGRSGTGSQVQPRRQLPHDAVLQGEEAGHGPVELHRPENGAGCGLGQPCRDADRLADPLEAAAHDPARLELAPDARGEVRLGRVRAPRQLPDDLVDPLAGDHRDALDRPQVGRSGLGDPGAQPVVLRVLRDVLEGYDGDRPPRSPRDGERRRFRPVPDPSLEGLDLPAHLTHRRGAICRLLREHPFQEASEMGGDGLLMLRRRRLRVPDRLDHLHGVGAPERKLARHELPEDDAEREDVASAVHFAAEGLLGRHVGDRAEERPGRGSRAAREDAPGVVGASGRRDVCREAEVEHFHAPFRRDHHVRRLHVPVDHAALVRRSERLGHLPHQLEDLRERRGAPLDVGLERLSFDVLQGDEREPLPVLLHLGHLVDDADRRMRELGGEPRLAEKPEPARVSPGALLQDLQRHRPVEVPVLREKDLAHPAGAERPDHAVAGRAFDVHR